jgi:hypothetical protein
MVAGLIPPAKGSVFGFWNLEFLVRGVGFIMCVTPLCDTFVDPRRLTPVSLVAQCMCVREGVFVCVRERKRKQERE